MTATTANDAATLETAADRRRVTLLVAAAFAGGLLLHVDRLPLWCTAIACVAIGWRLIVEWRAIRLPSRWLRALLAFLLIVAVLVTFRTLNGLSAGTALLAAMGALKLLETHARRDRFIVVGAACFLLLAACLDRQTLLRVPLYCAQAWLACTALALLAAPRPALTTRMAARIAGKSLLFALPLAIVFFLFFPRLGGSFWSLPSSGAARTGLSDEMSPGSISELTDSDEPAFRVHFDGAPPPARQRYWRGPVLHSFDGYTWRRERVPLRQPPLEFLGPSYAYRVTLEPSEKPWWFALERVTGSPDPQVYFTHDYQLVAAEPVREATSYRAVSYPDAISTATLSLPARRLDTRLPAKRNPRSRDLAERLRAQAGSDQRFAMSVIELFRTGGFEYTLTPPRLDLDSVDDFLFRTRRGFCGHYASAFVSLMRAGGVPARVVSGYQGGEWNPVGRYLLVRQSDAHAWAEIWLEGRGWTRFDPTAVVAPERLTQGVFDLLPDAMSMQNRIVRSSEFLSDVAQRWDALNTWWHDRVIDYDFRMQLRLLDRLGIDEPDVRELGLMVSAALIAWLGWVTWQVRRSLRASRSMPLARAYETLGGKLARVGLARAAHEGPLDYAARIARTRPDLAASAGTLCRRYAALRFGPAANATETARFVREVGQLRVAAVSTA